MKQPGNGCNYDDAESRPDCISNTDRDGFQNGITLDLREFQQQQEKDFLQTSLQQAKFNQKKAAELLGLTYHQLRALLKKHQI